MFEIDSKIKILIVSSDPETALSCKGLLKKVGLSDVKILESGIDALKLCETTKFGLVICDQEMRHMKGWLFIQELKNSEKIANVATVFMGHDSSPIPVETLRQYGVFGYLSVPLVTKNMMELISATLADMKSATSVEGLFSAAKTAFLAQETQLAIEGYSRLYERTEKGVRSTIGLVNSYELGNMESEARNYALELVDHSDSMPVGIMVSLRYVYQAGLFEKAKALTEELLRKTEDTPIYFASALELSQVYKQFELGEVIARKALSLGFKGSNFSLAIARSEFAGMRIDDALVTLKRAIKDYGQSLEMLNLQGVCLKHQKKYEESKRSYELALALSPMDEKIYFNLALSEIHLNNIELAKRHLNTCLSIAPGFEKARVRLEELEQSTPITKVS